MLYSKRFFEIPNPRVSRVREPYPLPGRMGQRLQSQIAPGKNYRRERVPSRRLGIPRKKPCALAQGFSSPKKG
jgi:hypothetical protein